MRAAGIATCLAVALLGAGCSNSDPVTQDPRRRANVVGGSEGSGGQASSEDAFRLPRARRLIPSEWVIGPSRRMSFLIFVGRAAPREITALLDTLERRGAPAAFFMPGRYLRAHRDISEEIVSAGHHLGHTGWKSKPLTRLDRKALKRTLRRAERAVARAGSDPRPFLVMPRGKRDVKSLSRVGRFGYRSVRATVRLGDGAPKELARRAVAEAQPGAILQLDPARRSHRRAVARIVSRLHELDLEPMPLSRLRGAKPVRWDVTLSAGMEGPQVERLQEELAQGSFPPGAPDGVFGQATYQGVMAFEKLNGAERDGIVDPVELERIVTAVPPPSPERAAQTFIDVDLTRQILFEVVDGEVLNTIPISSANGEHYRSRGGNLAVAHTPRGDFEIERKIPGWRTSYLGSLYNPLYFYGGYAIHGSSSVPSYPASHGCIRIPMHVAGDFYARTALNTPVYVHD